MTVDEAREGLSRRHLIAGAAAVGVGIPVLAACSGDSADVAAEPAGSGGPSSTAPETSTPTSTASGGGSAALASTADVPVGGGLFLDDPSVVITQPAEGEFHAFDRACTHQGCPVSDIVDGEIHCTCHDSMFSMTDGAPVAGPAAAPLATVAITVEGDQILPA